MTQTRTIFSMKMKAVGGLLAVMFIMAMGLWFSDGMPGLGNDVCEGRHTVRAEVKTGGRAAVIQWSLGNDTGDTEASTNWQRSALVSCGRQIHVSAVGLGSPTCHLFLDDRPWGSGVAKDKRCSVTRAVP